MLEELFFDGVLVEPGDGAQPPGDGGPGAAAGFQFAAKGLNVGAADREQRQGPCPAPASELPQVEGVGLAGQAAVPSQEPGEREPLGISEARLDGARAVEWVVAVIRAPPETAGTRKAGPPKVPAMNDARNVCRPLKMGDTTIRG